MYDRTPPPPSTSASSPSASDALSHLHDPLLTLSEVCEQLGVSMRTLRRWRRDERLRAGCVAGTVRVRLSDLERALGLHGGEAKNQLESGS